jgi:hypothetical protein
MRPPPGYRELGPHRYGHAVPQTRTRRSLVSLTVMLALVAGCQGKDDETPAASPSPKPTKSQQPVAARDIALVRAGQVQISSGTQPLRSVAAVTSGVAVGELIWSADKKSLAWLESPEGEGGNTVVLADVTTGVAHRWAGCTCARIAFRGSDLVSDGDGAPALRTYPADGSKARPWALRGLPAKGAGSLLAPVLDLLTGASNEVYVGYANGGQSTYGGPQTVYRVDTDGTATALNSEQANGMPHDGMLSADGKTLAYLVNTHASACEDPDGVSLVDVATGKATSPALPAAAGRSTVISTWFDATGQPWAAALTGLADCLTSVPNPVIEVVPEVYREVDGKWVATGRKAIAGADLGGGQTAWLTGSVQSNGVQLGARQPGTLTVEANGVKPRQVADQVTLFAVAPA